MGSKGKTGRGPLMPRSCWGWFLALMIVLVLTAGTVGWIAFTVNNIRENELPHCYRIFGTGPDVVPGPGEDRPFSPALGAMIKGRVQVGDLCFRWEIICFNLTSPATEMHLHGMLLGNTTAPVFIDMGVDDFTGTNGDHLTRKDCLPLTYEQEEAILTRPDEFYLDLHSDDFPDGALRSPLGVRCGGNL